MAGVLVGIGLIGWVVGLVAVIVRLIWNKGWPYSRAGLIVFVSIIFFAGGIYLSKSNSNQVSQETIENSSNQIAEQTPVAKPIFNIMLIVRKNSKEVQKILGKPNYRGPFEGAT